MFLAVQLESRLIYCLNKARLTASASVISHRTVLTGSRLLGWEWSGGGSRQPLPLRLLLSLSLKQGWWQKAQLGPCYHSHLMERGLQFRVPGQIYLDRLSFEVHTCGRVKDTWCILDVLESVSSIELLCCMVLTSKIAVEYAFDTMLGIVFFQRDMLRGG